MSTLEVKKRASETRSTELNSLANYFLACGFICGLALFCEVMGLVLVITVDYP